MPTTNASPRADWDLAQRCAGGEQAAQRELFERHRERVHLILFRILGSNRDMEDLAQEAFVAVFRALPSYRGEALLATYIDRICARVAFRYLSQRAPVPTHLHLVQAELSAPGGSLEQELHSRELTRRLYSVLDRLPAKYRVAYALHVLDERPLSEVAAVTEVSLIAAKNRVWRARRMVQRAARADAVLREFVESRRGR